MKIKYLLGLNYDRVQNTEIRIALQRVAHSCGFELGRS